MKRFIQLTLASLVAVLSVGLTPLVSPAGAIDVFKAGCDNAATGGGDTSGSGASDGATPATGDSDTADSGTDGNSGTGGSSSSGGGGASTICGAAKQDDATKIVSNVINTILFALGIAAVVMIVIGGIRYTTSNGDSGNIKSAKDTILYAVVGLVVAMMAFLIVNFVIDRLGK
jgi:hypothetical protein